MQTEKKQTEACMLSMSELEKIISAAMKLLGWILKQCPSGCFQVIKVSDLEKFAGKHGTDTWFYAFMNRAKKLYAVNFNSLEELRHALFDADQIVYGNPGDPKCCKPNPLYQKSDEEILTLVDLGML